jgi:hypothetical protein
MRNGLFLVAVFTLLVFQVWERGESRQKDRGIQYPAGLIILCPEGKKAYGDKGFSA